MRKMQGVRRLSELSQWAMVLETDDVCGILFRSTMPKGYKQEQKAVIMSIKDFEDWFKVLSTSGEIIILLNVHLFKGKVKWFLCKLNGVLCVYDSNGRCFVSEDDNFDILLSPCADDKGRVWLTNSMCIRCAIYDVQQNQKEVCT